MMVQDQVDADYDRARRAFPLGFLRGFKGSCSGGLRPFAFF